MKTKKKFKNWFIGYLFILPNFIGFFLFMGIPIVMGFIISFTDYNGFNQFNFVGITNFVNLFKDEYFLISLKNNVIYTVIAVPCTIIMSLLLALAVNSKIKGAGFFKVLFFFPTISSMVVVGTIWSMLLNPTRGIINQILFSIGVAEPPQWLVSSQTALLSIIMVAVWKSAGYYMVMFLGGLQQVPNHLYESASIDGAGKIRKFFSITFPMLSPTMFMVTILNIISSFQIYDLIAVMTSGGPGRSTNVLVFRIYQEGFNYLRYGYASAMAYFLFLIIMVITLIQFHGQKKWVTYID
jgi:multiple sugar transport system permease protein